MRDKLLGALIGLARATENNEELVTATTHRVIKDGLTATMSNFSYDDATYESLYEKVMEEKRRIIPSCFTCEYPCGRTDNFNMQELWDMDEDVRALKMVLLSGVQTLAAQDYEDEETMAFIYKGLMLIGIYWDAEGMVPFLQEMGNIQLKQMKR